MKIIYDSNYLCHHGVKGMKWGRRKQRYAQKSIKKYGSKKEAVAALTRKANRGAKVRQFGKRVAGTAVGASGFIGSAGAAVASVVANAASTSLAAASASGAAASGASAALGILGTVGTVGAIGAAGLLGVGALGVAGAVKAKAKYSSRKKNQIETVQNYKKRA